MLPPNDHHDVDFDFDRAYRVSRRHYEIGRFWGSARHAAIAATLVATAAGLCFGKRALVWIPISFLAIMFTEWRGAFLMKGARRGLIAGFASMLLPLSILRPCCGIDGKAMGAASCCTMPSACWAAGAAVGLAMAIILPKAPTNRRQLEAALGMIIGVTSVAMLRCSILFLGETVGLVGGITVGVIASSLARAWLAPTTSS